MTDADRDRRRDEATIILLEATAWRRPRDVLRDCRHCARPFWAHTDQAAYCSPRCHHAADYRRARDRILVYQAAYRARRRSEERLRAASARPRSGSPAPQERSEAARDARRAGAPARRTVA